MYLGADVVRGLASGRVDVYVNCRIRMYVFVEIVFFIMLVWCGCVLYIGDYEYLVVLFLWYYNHHNIGGGTLFVRVI